MLIQTRWLALIAALLAGCTRTTPNDFTADHPAHPGAAEARPLQPSGVLAVRTTNGAGEAAADTPDVVGPSDHSEHQPGHVGRAEGDHEESAPSTAATSLYACPMHPAVVSDQPGKCPRCKMKLKPVKKKQPAKTGSAGGQVTGHDAHDQHGGHRNADHGNHGGNEGHE